MTYLIWEKQLLGYLKSQPAEDKKQIVDYYREMYYDKVERGESPEQVLSEFGDPKNCAAKIIIENAADEEKTAHAPEKEYTAPKSEKRIETYYPPRRRVTGAGVIGWFFLTVLLLIPLGAVWVSVVASFAAGLVSGYAMILAGVLYAVASPFGMIFGWSGALALAGVGTGIVTAGVGSILAVVFTLLTEYSALGLFKAIVILIKGRS